MVAAAAYATRPPPSSAISKFILSNGMVDYYELMGVDDCASSADIKLAYRTIAKVRCREKAIEKVATLR